MFREATGGADPFPYQIAFAESWQLPELVNVPTGAGKTATAILGWLWRPRFAEDKGISKQTPRRLVYCLPMRVLVEQTCKEAEKWLANLKLQEEIRVHRLMGGEDASDWDLYPESDAILIGSQDMILSRALNRGYGMSRFRWPMQYALMNNDSLWILDEIPADGSWPCHIEPRLTGVPGKVPHLWFSKNSLDVGDITSRMAGDCRFSARVYRLRRH